MNKLQMWRYMGNILITCSHRTMTSGLNVWTAPQRLRIACCAVADIAPISWCLAETREFPGDDMLCPMTEPNVISNSTIIVDELAKFSQQARLEARKALLQELDQKAARTALNSRPRPHRSFKPGDEVAVWRRGRGIPGKMSHARWRGPGIVAGVNGNHYWVSMPGAMIKCSVEQLRFRTIEEGEADKFWCVICEQRQ